MSRIARLSVAPSAKKGALWPVVQSRRTTKWSLFGVSRQSLQAGLWPFVNEKGRVRSSPVRPKRGDRRAHPTDHDDTSAGSVRATFLKARLGSCSGASGRNHTRSGQEDRNLRSASSRSRGGEAVLPLPSSA